MTGHSFDGVGGAPRALASQKITAGSLLNRHILRGFSLRPEIQHPPESPRGLIGRTRAMQQTLATAIGTDFYWPLAEGTIREGPWARKGNSETKISVKKRKSTWWRRGSFNCPCGGGGWIHKILRNLGRAGGEKVSDSPLKRDKTTDYSWGKSFGS